MDVLDILDNEMTLDDLKDDLFNLNNINVEKDFKE